MSDSELADIIKSIKFDKVVLDPLVSHIRPIVLDQTTSNVEKSIQLMHLSRAVNREDEARFLIKMAMAITLPSTVENHLNILKTHINQVLIPALNILKDYVPSVAVILQKSADGKSHYISGIASDVLEDRDGDVMEMSALMNMKEAVDSGHVPIFLDHTHTLENQVGWWKHADIIDGQLRVEGRLDNPSYNPKSAYVLSKLEEGSPLGLSIGGDMGAHHREGGVRKLEEVNLYEISLVGLPSNARSVVTGTTYKGYD